MKLLIPLIILCAPVLTYGQLKTEYDRFENVTTVSTKTRYVAPRLEFRAYFVSGEKRPSIVALAFYSRSRSWRFLELNDLIIIADDKRLTFPKISRRANLARYAGVEESLIFECSPKQLETIVNGKKVEARLGIVEFKFGGDTVKDLKALLSALGHR